MPPQGGGVPPAGPNRAPTAADLVRSSARAAPGVRAGWGYARPAPLPGYGVQVLAGKARAATEHRRQELRALSGGAVPGQTGGVYEPARNGRVDVVPGAAGPAPERALLPAIGNTVQRGAGWRGERNFGVTDVLVGLAARGADFSGWEPAQGRVTPQQARGHRGRVETGTGAAQAGVLTRAGQPPRAGRRGAGRVDQPPRAGDRSGALLTTRPPAGAAAVVAQASRRRWPVDPALPMLATALASEIDTLAYPQAALCGFCVAVGTYNGLAIATAAGAPAPGAERSDREFADYELAAA